MQPLNIPSKLTERGRNRDNNGLRSAKLVAISPLEQDGSPTSAPTTEECAVEAVTPPHSISQIPSTVKRQFRTPFQDVGRRDSLPPPGASISAIDTAVMVALQPGGYELGHPEMLVNGLVADIAQEETWILPSVPSARGRGEEDEQSQTITTAAGGAAIAGAGDITFAALRYVTNVAMAHLVPPSTFGTFGEVYAVVTVVGWIAKLGMDSVVLRFLSTYRVRGTHDLTAGLMRFALGVSYISSILCGALFFLLSPLMVHLIYRNPLYERPLQEIAFLVPLLALQPVYASVLQAYKAIKWKVVVDRLSQPTITLLALLAFFFLGMRFEALSLSTACGFAVSIIIGQFLLAKVKKTIVGGTRPRFDTGVWMRFALPLLLNGTINSILISTDVLFLGVYSSPDHVATYVAADRVGAFVTMPFTTLNIIFTPIIVEHHVKGKYTELAGLFKVVNKWSISLSLPVFLCCVVFHDPILAVFGEQYIRGSLVLIIVCFGNFINAGTGSAVQMLLMTGRSKIILLNTILTVVINIGLSLYLIPRFDIIGAALAASLSVIIINCLFLIEVYGIMRIHPFRWDVLKPLLAGLCASVAGFLLLRFFQLDYGRFALLEALGLVIPFILVYILAMVLLRFSKEDRFVLDAVLAKFGKQGASNQFRASW